MSDDLTFRLSEIPVHLGLGAKVTPEAAFTETPDWYQRYSERHQTDGSEGRLVTMHTFDESWTSWEMHPHGEELVVCISGPITLIQETLGDTLEVALATGDAVVNPAGVWHTADATGPATALFITAGMGTEVRSR